MVKVPTDLPVAQCYTVLSVYSDAGAQVIMSAEQWEWYQSFGSVVSLFV